MRWTAVVGVLLVCPAVAAADESKHLVYGEVLGKAGLYGLGYEYALTHRLSLGAAASFAPINDEKVTTLSPYIHARILGEHRNRLFGELGAVIAHSNLDSPVMGWDGMATTGGGAFGSVGWERRTEHLVLRVSASLVVGLDGGAAPTVGFMIGFPL